jgi:hypothetical protein
MTNSRIFACKECQKKYCAECGEDRLKNLGRKMRVVDIVNKCAALLSCMYHPSPTTMLIFFI